MAEEAVQPIPAPKSREELEAMLLRLGKIKRLRILIEQRTARRVTKAQEEGRLDVEPLKAQEDELVGPILESLKQFRDELLPAKFGKVEFRHATADFHNDGVGTLDFGDNEKTLITLFENVDGCADFVNVVKTLKKPLIKDAIKTTPELMKPFMVLMSIIHNHSLIVTFKPTPAEQRRAEKAMIITEKLID